MGKPPKIIAIVMNIIVVAICAVAISAFFIKPLFSFSANVTLTPEMMDMVKKQLPEDSGSAGDGEISEREIMEDVLTQIGKDNITVSAGITLQTAEVLSSLSASEEETKTTISSIIENNVNSIIDNFSGSIDKVVESLSKSVVKVSVKSTLKAEIEKQEIKDDNGNTMTVDEVLTDLGLTDEYLDDTTQKLLDAMKDENATTDTIADEAINVVNEVLNKVNENAKAEDAKEAYKNLEIPAELDDAKKQEVKDAVTKILNDYADEDGKVNLDNVIYTLIGQALDKQNNENDNTEEAAADEEILVTMSTESGSSESGESGSSGEKKQYTKEDVKQMLHDRVMENVTDQVLSGITLALKILSGVIIFTFAIWGWLVFKIIVKLIARNPMIKLWPPIWFGNVLFPILYAIPSAIAFLFGNIGSLPANISAQLQSALGESAYSSFISVGSSISLEATSCTFITFIMTIVLFVYSIVYWIVRNKYKRAV